MSLQQVHAVLSAARNAGFAAQLGTDEALLTGYDLTEEERAALVGGDAEKLRGLGVDEELLAGLEDIAAHR